MKICNMMEMMVVKRAVMIKMCRVEVI